MPRTGITDIRRLGLGLGLPDGLRVSGIVPGAVRPAGGHHFHRMHTFLKKSALREKQQTKNI
jgi:hypothetical protein